MKTLKTTFLGIAILLLTTIACEKDDALNTALEIREHIILDYNEN